MVGSSEPWDYSKKPQCPPASVVQVKRSPHGILDSPSNPRLHSKIHALMEERVWHRKSLLRPCKVSCRAKSHHSWVLLPRQLNILDNLDDCLRNHAVNRQKPDVGFKIPIVSILMVDDFPPLPPVKPKICPLWDFKSQIFDRFKGLLFRMNKRIKLPSNQSSLTVHFLSFYHCIYFCKGIATLFLTTKYSKSYFLHLLKVIITERLYTSLL